MTGLEANLKVIRSAMRLLEAWDRWIGSDADDDFYWALTQQVDDLRETISVEASNA